ncbi:MAG: hypothetical protein IKX37_05335 [Bacteroidales bacterium]|nr:hypothetical protein [Bacteroidales bacterium]
MTKRIIYFLLATVVPAGLYAAYAATEVYIWRCLIIFWLLGLVLWIIFAAPKERRDKYMKFIPAAFGFSIVGDYLLHLAHDKGAMFFIAGVIAYFIAHMSYIGFTMRKGKVNWWMFALLCVVFGLYFVFLLIPGIESMGIRIAVLAYIFVSAFSVSTASATPFGPTMDRTGKLLVLSGVCSLVVSDILLSLHDFAGIPTGYFLMLPLFYLSQVLVTCGLIHITAK